MMPTEITRDEAIGVFARRLPPWLSREVIEQTFDLWLKAGCLDFCRSSDGRLRVSLIERQTRQ
jgi:hypothetical protein